MPEEKLKQNGIKLLEIRICDEDPKKLKGIALNGYVFYEGEELPSSSNYDNNTKGPGISKNEIIIFFNLSIGKFCTYDFRFNIVQEYDIVFDNQSGRLNPTLNSMRCFNLNKKWNISNLKGVSIYLFNEPNLMIKNAIADIVKPTLQWNSSYHYNRGFGRNLYFNSNNVTLNSHVDTRIVEGCSFLCMGTSSIAFKDPHNTCFVSYKGVTVALSIIPAAIIDDMKDTEGEIILIDKDLNFFQFNPENKILRTIPFTKNNLDGFSPIAVSNISGKYLLLLTNNNQEQKAVILKIVSRTINISPTVFEELIVDLPSFGEWFDKNGFSLLDLTAQQKDLKAVQDVCKKKILQLAEKLKTSIEPKHEAIHHFTQMMEMSSTTESLGWRVLTSGMTPEEFEELGIVDIFLEHFQKALINEDIGLLEGLMYFMGNFNQELIVKRPFISRSFHDALNANNKIINKLALEHLKCFTESTIVELTKKPASFKGKELVTKAFDDCLQDDPSIYNLAFDILKRWNQGIIFASNPDIYMNLYEKLRISAHHEAAINTFFQIEWERKHRHNFISFMLSREMIDGLTSNETELTEKIRNWKIIIQQMANASSIFDKDEILKILSSAAYYTDEDLREVALTTLSALKIWLATETWFIERCINHWTLTTQMISLEILKRFDVKSVRSVILSLYQQLSKEETSKSVTMQNTIFISFTQKISELARSLQNPGTILDFLVFLGSDLPKNEGTKSIDELFGLACPNNKFFIDTVLKDNSYLPLIQALCIYVDKKDFDQRVNYFLPVFLEQFFASAPIEKWPLTKEIISNTKKWKNVQKIVTDRLIDLGKKIKIFKFSDQYQIRDLKHSWFGAVFDIKNPDIIKEPEWNEVKAKFKQLAIAFEEIEIGK